MIFNRLSRRQKFSFEREARLLNFANPERDARAKEVKGQVEKERDARIARGIDTASALNTAGVIGRKLDPTRSAAFLDRNRTTRLMRETPKDRVHKGALDKADRIEEQFGSEDRIQGIEFGYKAGKFTVRATDEKVLADALGFVLKEVEGLQDPQSDPAVVFPKNKTESAGDYKKRIAALKEEYEADESSYSAQNNQEIKEWGLLLDALRNYESKFAASRAKIDAVRTNPLLIDTIFDEEWREENTPIYVELLRNAAIKVPSLLIGKEKFFTTDDLAAIIKEAAGIKEPKAGALEKTNPLVLQYLPDSIKKTDEYRGWMVDAAEVDGGVLLFAAREFDKFWKKNPDAYKALCNNAVSQRPELFFFNAEWLKPNTAQALRDVENALEPEAKVAIIERMNVGNLTAFNKLEGGFAGFIDRALNEPASVLGIVRALSRKESKDLFEYIKKNDNTLYMKIFAELAKVDPDIREARTAFEGVLDDEDLAKAVLVKLQEFLTKGNIDAIRDSKLDLQKIPESVWATGAYKKLFIEIFSAQGDLFELAPVWMRSKKEYAMPIIINNASAYSHASEYLRADPQLLYAALLAEKNKNGNMHWKHVPKSLRDRLSGVGFDGLVVKDDLADTDKMLRVLILGLKDKGTTLTPDQVHSFMDSWTPEMRKNKELVTAYLKRALPLHPEFYLDADKDLLRDDFSFAKKMVEVNPDVFSFITEEQHLSFEKSNQKEYRAIVAAITRYNPELFEKVPQELRDKAEFITDIFTRTGKAELLKYASKDMLKNVDFLVSVLQVMEQKGYVFKTISDFLKMLPEETGKDILLRNNGELLLKLLRNFKDERAERLLPSVFLRGDLLNRILLQFKDEGNRGRMCDILQYATPTARLAYFTEHPEQILYLFEKTPDGISSMLHESLITVDLLATLAEGYDDSKIQALFTEVLSGSKPLTLVGLLRRRQELWDVIGDRLQDKLLPLLDRDTLKMLRDGNEQREKVRKATNLGKALDDLRVYRQEAIYLLGLAPKTGEVCITWKDNKTYSITQLQTWLENDRVPAIMKKFAAGDATPTEIYEEVGLYMSLVQALRSSVNPVAADPEALKTPFDASVDATGIGAGEKTGELPSRINSLRLLIDVQKSKALPKDATEADKKKAKDFLKAAETEYAAQLKKMVESLSTAKLRGMNAESLRGFIRNVDKLVNAASERVFGTSERFEKEEWKRMLTDIESLKDQARTALRKVTEAPGVRDSEALYNLDASSLQFVEAAAKELGVNRFLFAKTLDKQGYRNARIISQEYLPLLKTSAQWEKVMQVSEAAGDPNGALGTFLEAGNLDIFGNYLQLSQEKHAVAILNAIRNDPDFPIGFNGEKGKLDAKADRAMVIMASREMGTAFDAGKLKTIWKEIRARQLDAFKSSPDILNKGPDKSAKKIDVFVIGEDDGPEGGAMQAAKRSGELTASLNGQHPGEGKLIKPRLVRDKQQFSTALEEFKKLAEDPMYAKDADRHLVLRVITHGNKRSGNALGIDPGSIAGELNSVSTTLLYTSCDGGTHLTEMFGTSLKGSKVNVLSETSATVTPMHMDETIDKKLAGAYEKGMDGKYAGDFNADGVVSIPEAFHWLDRNLRFQDPQGFGPGGKQFTDKGAGKKGKGIV